MFDFLSRRTALSMTVGFGLLAATMLAATGCGGGSEGEAKVPEDAQPLPAPTQDNDSSSTNTGIKVD